MQKFVKFVCGIMVVGFLFTLGIILADKQTLRTQIIRMHVVANSDSTNDQEDKLAVRDAIMQYLQVKLNDIKDIYAARMVLSEELSTLESIANETLAKLGNRYSARVTLTQEEFDKREYETFSLPSGVYESLRIQIGNGEGKNWWCVVFPSFCVPTSEDYFQSTAVSSGFNYGLAETLSNNNEYEFRFFLLDRLGKIENFLNIS